MFEIALSTPRIDDLAGQRIAVDGVDCKVTPCGSFGNGQEGVVGCFKSLVSESEFCFAARKGDVYIEMVQLYDAEGESDNIQLEFCFKGGEQFFHRYAVDFEVEVLYVGFAPEKAVAYATSDKQGPSASSGSL